MTLPYGSYNLELSATTPHGDYESRANVVVGPDPSVLNHTLGHNEVYMGAFLGVVAVIALGVGLTATGAGMSFGSDDGAHSSGPLVLGLGIAGLIGGPIMMYHSGLFQEGSTTQWAPADGKPFAMRGPR